MLNFSFGPTLVKYVLNSSAIPALLGSVQRAFQVFNAGTCELFRVVPLLVSDFQEKAVEFVEQLIGTIRFEKETSIP